jgi:DivIVA domain-containing protein
VALERQSIEKKDFPVGRRGYDPTAVDAHLSTIAAEVEELKRTSRRKGETLASAASEQVRAIVEAAENSAAEIQQRAEEEAREIRAEASRDSRREREEATTAAKSERQQAAAEARKEREQAAAAAQSQREQATTQAREYVGSVSQSTSQMLKRLEAMESELGALTESLRTGATRLNGELEGLESEMQHLSTTSAPTATTGAEEQDDTLRWGSSSGSAVETEPGAEEAERELETEEQTEAEAPAAEEPEAPVAEEAVSEDLEADDEVELEDEDEGPAVAAGGGSDDTEGARLIALNMALNGTPREETDRYLADNFELSDRGQLLDEVYASIEG